ncbi:DUF58 domain-containing protein [Streptacidiphilus sp. 4-A2]|nr:DUF58 domain-containing protein [Streptacidiphilus sp. 4-A2]
MRDDPVPLTWTPSPHTRALLTVAVAALALALIAGRPDAVVLAAPLLWAATSRRTRHLPAHAHLRVDLEPKVCFEDESAVLHIEVADADACRLELHLPEGLRLQDSEPVTLGASGSWTLRAVRWGRWSTGGLRLRLRSGDRLWQADAVLTPAQLTVYPRPAPPQLGLGGADRAARRIGEHATRLPGAGAEFAGVRPWVPGEAQRRVNWPATRRTGRLQVTAFADERAVDLVLCLDAYSAVGPPGRTTWTWPCAGGRAGAGLSARPRPGRGGDHRRVAALAGPGPGRAAVLPHRAAPARRAAVMRASWIRTWTGSRAPRCRRWPGSWSSPRCWTRVPPPSCTTCAPAASRWSWSTR